MNDMIVPNWHPVIVHFSVALLVTATVILMIAAIRKKSGPGERLQIVARTMFWIGAGALVLTVIAGLQAYYSVAHDGPSHSAMTDHRNWAFATLAVTVIAAVFMRRNHAKALSTLTMMSLLLSTGLVLATAYKGGDLVYRYGLGVMSIPSVTGEGHDHEHEGGSGQDHASANQSANETAVENHSSDDEHSQPSKPAEETVHTHADGKAHDHTEAAAAPTRTPEELATALSAAIKGGNKDVVRELLHEDVLVLESGHAQRSRDDYMSGHMLSDMAFLKNMTLKTVNQSVSIDADLAWVTTETHMTGKFKDREIDETTQEFLIMRKGDDGWKVTHIHWLN